MLPALVKPDGLIMLKKTEYVVLIEFKQSHKLFNKSLFQCNVYFKFVYQYT